MTGELGRQARWNAVPSTSDSDEAWRFALTYNGYLTHGATPAHLERAVAHVVAGDWSDGVVDRSSSTADLRAALFAMARAARMAGDELDPLPGTWQAILQELGERQDHPYLAVERSGHAAGFPPAPYECAEALLRDPEELALLAALHLKDRLDPHLLAWLGLTSKPELAVRDHLGWLLETSVAPVGQVAREWRRTNLAVLVDGKPRLLIEGKAMYGFDALSVTNRGKYVESIAADLRKASSLAPAATVIATLLLVCPHRGWSTEATPVVAYAGPNARFASDGEVNTASAIDVMSEALSDLGAVGVVDLGTGDAFDAPVSTTMFVIRPTIPWQPRRSGH